MTGYSTEETSVMARDHVVGVDLGGTNIKVGVVTAAGDVASNLSVPTEGQGGPDHVVNRMVTAALKAIDAAGLTKDRILAVGIGAPGSMSHKKGVIISPPNLPGWSNVPVRDMVAKGTGLPANLENDANAAAYGEYWAGGGRGTRDMVLFTLGTGIGGGVIIDGQLVRGFFDNGAELGHMIVQPGGRLCGCGQHGCVEAYASAHYTAVRAVEAVKSGEPSSLKGRLDQGLPVETPHVVDAANAGDPLARRIWDETCRYLAIACVNVQHFSNPQKILLAGGMIGAGKYLLDPVRKYFLEFTWKAAQDYPQIEFATLGNDSGFIGAAGLALAEVGGK
jgi:glucokinase